MSDRAIPPLLRRLNERTVLETIRLGAPISRAEISRRAGISKPTVSLALQSLLDAGLVRESRSAPQGPSWELRDASGALLCSLPCSVELDEREAVSVVRSDGRTRFVVRQEQLGEGAFSGSVRKRGKQTRGTIAARTFAAALTGAGSALAQADDADYVAAGVILSSVGAAARAAIDSSRPEREELWVQRSANPE